MPKIIVVHIPKGGNKKTTMAITLADLAAQRGSKVLLIDGDPNENCSEHLQFPEQKRNTLTHAFLDKGTVAELAIPNVRPNMDFLPSGGMRLHAAEAQLPLLAQTLADDGPEQQRRWILEAFERSTGDLSKYDLVFIDTWPHVGDLIYTLFFAADEVFVPINAEDSSLRMLGRLTKRIKFINKSRRKPLEISRIVLFRTDNSRHEQDAQSLIKEHFPNQFAGVVGKCTAFRDAFSHHQTIREFFGPDGRPPQKSEKQIMSFLNQLTEEMCHA